ncbi:MAG: response regulator [Candidatus Latescibacterota bacterium]|nr:response regulator [Candidatus Latescibacterota bacterium]
MLVVDDGDLFLRFCNRMLEREQFTVHTAGNGNEAMDMAANHSYDVVLMDINMPHMSGLACLEQLKKGSSEAEVIIVTGKGDLQTAVEAMKLGAADFIAKPFQTDALVSKIEGLVARPNPTTTNDGATTADWTARRRAYERRFQNERRLGSNDPVIAYIQRHATQISTRHDVAGVMGLTLEQVSARVQMTTGHSFRQWLNTCRLQKATQLLKDTELEIARIALDTGFATVQHFSRVFSNIAGVSPRKYRQQNRQSAANDKQK